MIRMIVELFSSVLGIVLGAVVVVAAAKAGLWGLHTWGFWGGVVAFPVVLLSGTGLLYLWLGDSDDKGDA